MTVSYHKYVTEGLSQESSRDLTLHPTDCLKTLFSIAIS